MKEKILFSLAVIFGLIPVYTFLGWIIIFNKYPERTHLEKQQIYNNEIFFGINATNNQFIGISIILFGVFAVLYLSLQLRKSEGEKKISVSKFIIVLPLIILFGVFTLLSIFMIL